MKEYVRIRDANKGLIANYCQQARGYRAADKFAVDCGTTARTFQTLLRKEKKVRHISWDLLGKIAAHADKRSPVTEEALRAANGEIDSDVLDGLLRYNKKQPKESIEEPVPFMLCSIDPQGNMSAVGYAEDTLDEVRPEDETGNELSDKYYAYAEFVSQMSAFMWTLTDTQVKYVMTKARMLFHDSVFAYLLGLYCDSLAETDDAICDAGYGKERLSKTAKAEEKVDVYLRLLKDYVLNGTYKWDDKKGIY